MLLVTVNKKKNVCLQINHGFTQPSEHELNSFVNELNFAGIMEQQSISHFDIQRYTQCWSKMPLIPESLKINRFDFSLIF